MRTLTQSAPVRKGKMFALKPYRAAIRKISRADDYARRPPIVVNSLPKSGTHLLLQIATALPGTRHFAAFIAQTPSMSTRPRAQVMLNRLIEAIVPGEVVGAHLYHAQATEQAITARNALHLFIHRDPRDVVLSEAHYLSEMNRWHSLHKYFKSEPSLEGRLRMAIEGLDLPHYPHVGQRIRAYLGWLDEPNCVALRYESLIDPLRRTAEIERIVTAYQALGADIKVSDALIRHLIDAIDPTRSHTFNKGGAERWRAELSPELMALFAQKMPELSWGDTLNNRRDVFNPIDNTVSEQPR